ncbi:Transient receptor potential-gamma protein [Zootermopsis nevadensis]|uniref:Transient receptor potential-gamma protein n=1 Tax=Zootermopsis nevadensis TaxID=136037 RepID=A0A067QGK5_ZOONE|nr:Transient receptor potential-gamma protein [Zootermopsis nevadensis]
MEALFVIAAVFKILAYIDMQNSNLANEERKYWDHLDNTLIGEGFFALATIFAYLRLLLLLQLNLQLGPLLVRSLSEQGARPAA